MTLVCTDPKKIRKSSLVKVKEIFFWDNYWSNLCKIHLRISITTQNTTFTSVHFSLVRQQSNKVNGWKRPYGAQTLWLCHFRLLGRMDPHVRRKKMTSSFANCSASLKNPFALAPLLNLGHNQTSLALSWKFIMVASAVMASLPTVSSLGQCADYSRTVHPYIHQVQPFFQQVWDNISDFGALKEVYLSTNPLVSAFAFALFASPVVLVISEANKNYSQVDRIWSILPALYIAHYSAWAHMNDLPTERIDNVLAISVTWGVSFLRPWPL